MPSLKLDDGEIYYEVRGSEGKWLTFIHGAYASHRWWKFQVDELSKDYRTLALDLRGHGNSSPLRNKVTLDKLAEDVHKLHEHLGIKETVLIGWSLGGMVSMKYAILYPEVVRGLVLISTRMRRRRFFRILAAANNLMARLRSMLDFMMIADSMEKSIPDYEKELREALKKGLPEDVPLDYLEDLTKDFLRASFKESFDFIVKSIANFRLDDGVRNIRAPTLIMVGDKDSRTPPKLSEEIHRNIANSKLKIIPGGSHYMIVEQPSVINAEIRRFLKEIGY